MNDAAQRRRSSGHWGKIREQVTGSEKTLVMSMTECKRENLAKSKGHRSSMSFKGKVKRHSIVGELTSKRTLVQRVQQKAENLRTSIMDFLRVVFSMDSFVLLLGSGILYVCLSWVKDVTISTIFALFLVALYMNCVGIGEPREGSPYDSSVIHK
jgi:hypothetical protein